MARGAKWGSQHKGNSVSRKPNDSGQEPAPAWAASKRPVNRICPMDEGPVGSFCQGADRCRTFRGRTVGFCGAECARAWDELDDAEKQQRLADALAA